MSRGGLKPGVSSDIVVQLQKRLTMNVNDGFPHCDCFDQYRSIQRSETRFHGEVQDTGCASWKRLLELIDSAVADGRTEFSPGQEMARDQWTRVIILPASISRLKAVRRFVL
jgi:hypothetical protein